MAESGISEEKDVHGKTKYIYWSAYHCDSSCDIIQTEKNPFPFVEFLEPQKSKKRSRKRSSNTPKNRRLSKKQ